MGFSATILRVVMNNSTEGALETQTEREKIIWKEGNGRKKTILRCFVQQGHGNERNKTPSSRKTHFWDIFYRILNIKIFDENKLAFCFFFSPASSSQKGIPIVNTWILMKK